ncbi:MAG TPA: hypothetical protein VG498_12525 [Terriglobales bacterium]|nr:hypothetical protein [Terriglobales bacterium]
MRTSARWLETACLVLSSIILMVATSIPYSLAQSNHAALLMASGTWRLHSRIPLGSERLVLEPGHKPVEMLASAEAPEFEGWTLEGSHNKPVLLDAARKPVEDLPHSIVFRVTVSSRCELVDPDPLPVDWSKNVSDFLLDVHFRLQIFRGMQMREIDPQKTWMIGIPADEPADERIYRSLFDLGDVRPDDRIVLLVTDGAGNRLGKFHLEFL